jgi:hypothetical protein
MDGTSVPPLALERPYSILSKILAASPDTRIWANSVRTCDEQVGTNLPVEIFAQLLRLSRLWLLPIWQVLSGTDLINMSVYKETSWLGGHTFIRSVNVGLCWYTTILDEISQGRRWHGEHWHFMPLIKHG